MPPSVRDRAALLKDDFSTLDEVERQLAVYQKDLMRDFEFRISDIDRILLEMEKRGHEFFDDNAANRPRDGSPEPQPDAAGIRAEGGSGRAAADRAQGRRARRLAGGRRPAPVAGRHEASGRAAPAVPGPHRRRRFRTLPLRPHAPHRLGRPRVAEGGSIRSTGARKRGSWRMARAMPLPQRPP